MWGARGGAGECIHWGPCGVGGADGRRGQMRRSVRAAERKEAAAGAAAGAAAPPVVNAAAAALGLEDQGSMSASEVRRWRLGAPEGRAARRDAKPRGRAFARARTRRRKRAPISHHLTPPCGACVAYALTDGISPGRGARVAARRERSPAAPPSRCCFSLYRTCAPKGPCGRPPRQPNALRARGFTILAPLAPLGARRARVAPPSAARGAPPPSNSNA